MLESISEFNKGPETESYADPNPGFFIILVVYLLYFAFAPLPALWRSQHEAALAPSEANELEVG